MSHNPAPFACPKTTIGAIFPQAAFARGTTPDVATSCGQAIAVPLLSADSVWTKLEVRFKLIPAMIPIWFYKKVLDWWPPPRPVDSYM